MTPGWRNHEEFVILGRSGLPALCCPSTEQRPPAGPDREAKMMRDGNGYRETLLDCIGGNQPRHLLFRPQGAFRVLLL